MGNCNCMCGKKPEIHLEFAKASESSWTGFQFNDNADQDQMRTLVLLQALLRGFLHRRNVRSKNPRAKLHTGSFTGAGSASLGGCAEAGRRQSDGQLTLSSAQKELPAAAGKVGRLPASAKKHAGAAGDMKKGSE